MAYDMNDETLRHQAGWKGFVVFLTASTVTIIIALAIMALTLL